MPDPIWVDTNIIIYALRGDADVNEQLSSYRKSGRQLLVPPAVNSEVLNGNVLTMDNSKPVWEQAPSPAKRSARETGMRRIGLQVDWSSARISRESRVDYTMIASSGKGSLKEVSESDRLVMAQVKAGAEARGVKKPQMITGEGPKRAIVTQSRLWNIEIVPKKAASSGRMPPQPPRINLADYPADPQDKKSLLSRFFKDRPVLTKLGLLGGSMLASHISGLLLGKVQAHFETAVFEADKELEAKYPRAEALARRAGIDNHKKAYAAAVSRLNAPSKAKVAATIMLAFTPNRDMPAAYREFQKQISKVKLADGEVGGYVEAASAYLNAMADLHETLSKHQVDLPQAADDIEKRGRFLLEWGDKLMDPYSKFAQLAMGSPISYHLWMEVRSVGAVFRTIGERVSALAKHIRALFAEYESMQRNLDKELIRLSDELGKYDP